MALERVCGEAAKVNSVEIDAVHELGSEGAPGSALTIIGGQIFLQDCIGKGMQAALSLPVKTYSSVGEFNGDGAAIALVIIVLTTEGGLSEFALLNVLPTLVVRAPVVVLADKYDLDLTRAVIGHGAKGFIPMTMEFDVAIGVVRLVMAGGTYVPAESLLSPPSRIMQSRIGNSYKPVTDRQLAVLRAIQQGKSNKAIAYELNMTESTVKVHVRNINKRLGAKNRTDLAIKSSVLFT